MKIKCKSCHKQNEVKPVATKLMSKAICGHCKSSLVDKEFWTKLRETQRQICFENITKAKTRGQAKASCSGCGVKFLRSQLIDHFDHECDFSAPVQRKSQPIQQKPQSLRHHSNQSSNLNYSNEKKKVRDGSTYVGTGALGAQNSRIYADNVVLNATRGHGFAAEKANHMIDQLKGKNAKLVGGNNLKDGADRIVNGVKIQTKYCSTGSKCVSECFRDGHLRYVNADGTPMNIEVPSDQYESAVQAMKARIQRGQVPGVRDPAEAKNIIRKGSITYQQALNMAKAGTIEGLLYDASNGIRVSGWSGGISAITAYAIACFNGESSEVALKSAVAAGLRVGGVSFVTSVITSQVGRTGVEQGLRGTTDWAVKQLGSKTTAAIANAMRSGKELPLIHGASASSNLSKLLRGNIVTGVAVTLVLSTRDLLRLFDGQISGAQLFKNVTKTGAGVAGGTAGWLGGSAVGASIGSVVPIIGTGIGAVVGGIAGALGGGYAATEVTGAVLDEFIEDDAEEMLAILQREFSKLGTEFLLNQSEAEQVLGTLKGGDLIDDLRYMYQSDQRRAFARRLLTPIIEDQVRRRPRVSIPSNQDLLNTLAVMIGGAPSNQQSSSQSKAQSKTQSKQSNQSKLKPKSNRDIALKRAKSAKQAGRPHVECPQCNMMVKTQNLLRHFDKVHR